MKVFRRTGLNYGFDHPCSPPPRANLDDKWRCPECSCPLARAPCRRRFGRPNGLRRCEHALGWRKQSHLRDLPGIRWGRSSTGRLTPRHTRPTRSNSFSDVRRQLDTHPLVSSWAVVWILGGRPSRERPRDLVEPVSGHDRGELLRLCNEVMDRHAFKFPIDDGTIEFRRMPWTTSGQVDLDELTRYAYAQQTELGGR